MVHHDQVVTWFGVRTGKLFHLLLWLTYSWSSDTSSFRNKGKPDSREVKKTFFLFAWTPLTMALRDKLVYMDNPTQPKPERGWRARSVFHKSAKWTNPLYNHTITRSNESENGGKKTAFFGQQLPYRLKISNYTWGVKKKNKKNPANVRSTIHLCCFIKWCFLD